jgi:sugar/nucleoside kinase (ribokinase family)
MKQDKNILVVGELNIDLILNDIRGVPVVGTEIMAGDMNITLGSSSAIFAANIAMLGISTSFCGMLGKDSFGKFILEELNRKHVNTDYITQSVDDKTGLTVVMNYSQDRAMVTYGGAMETFSLAHIPEDLSLFGHLHVSSYFLHKALKADIPALFKKAKEDGLTTSLDLQWDPENEWMFPFEECLPDVDVFLPNETEILLLTKLSSIEDAAIKLAPFANLIIIKRGTKGALAYDKGNFIASPPMLHNNFIDAIGAGDSFNAGFISRYLQGNPLESCLRFANLCGAINTTESGGTAAFADIGLFKEKAKSLFNIEVLL